MALTSILAISILSQAPNAAPDERTIASWIDALTEVGDATTGVNSLASFRQFMAVDEPPEFAGGMLGVGPSSLDPTMQKLCRAGVKALPQLLEHLQDARPTRLTVEHRGGLGGMWFSNEYDPRVPHGQYLDPLLSQLHTRDDIDGVYTIRVGDLCFDLIGQIVNRSLRSVRPQPTNCIVINSPVERPMLAEKTRKDWVGLTANTHESLLMNEASAGCTEALKRLLYYYPETGRTIALEQLARPLKDRQAVRWLHERIEKVHTAAELQELRELGIERLHYDAAISEWNGLQNELDWATSKAERDRIRARIESLFGNKEPVGDARADSMVYFDFQSLAAALYAFGDPALDGPCLDMFLRFKLSIPRLLDAEDRKSQTFYAEGIAMALAERLLVSGGTLGLMVYAEFLRDRERERKAQGESPESNAWHERMSALLRRLEPSLYR